MKSTKKSAYISNPFKLVFEGLDRLFTHNQTMAIIIIAFGLFGMFGNFGSFPSSNSATTGTSSGTLEPGAIALIAIIIISVMLIILPIIIFVSTIYKGMVSYTIHETSQGRTVIIKDAFKAALNKFWVIVWIQIIVGLKILGGLLLFIIPGIRAALRYKMVLLPVFDNDASAKEAIQSSKVLTKNHLIEVFGMSFAAGIIPIVGPALDAGGQSIMYPQLKQLQTAQNPQKPDVHWLNYLGFIVIGFLVLLVGIGIAAIVALANR